MNIPNLNNLIKALECDNWYNDKCKYCEFNYQRWDDNSDHGIWACDEKKKIEDALFYLKLY